MKSLGPPLVPPRPIVPNVPDVPVWDDAGPRMLDGSRPSDFDSTSDSVPCQLFDIRLVPVIVTPKDASRRADRKSTRLNSSHLGISYAVFCLKKKKNTLKTRD